MNEQAIDIPQISAPICSTETEAVSEAGPSAENMELYGHFLQTIGPGEKRCEKLNCPNFAPAGKYPPRQKFFFCSDAHRKWFFRGHVWGTCAWCGEAIRVRNDNPKVRNHFCNALHNHLFRSDHLIRGRAGIFMPILEEYVSTYVKIHYRKPYGARNALSYFFLFLNEVGIANLDDVTPKVITRFLAWEVERGGPKGPKYLSYVTTFFDWMIGEGRRVHANPVVPRIHRLKAPQRLPRPYSEEEVAEIWRLLTERGNARVRLAVAIGEEAGLRIGEVCNLRLQDVDMAKQTLFVRTPNKTDRSRQCFFHSRTLHYLDLWMQERDPNCGHDFLLHNTRNNPCTPNALNLEFRSVLCLWRRRGKNAIKANETGLDSFSFHRLRHYMATSMARGGADAQAIMAQGGWVTASAMCGYAEVDPTQAARAYNEAMERARAESQVPTKRVSGFEIYRQPISREQ